MSTPDASLFKPLDADLPLEELPGWTRVFAPGDTPWVFQSDLPDREVLYPTEGPWLTERQYGGLLAALSVIGESEYLWSVVEAPEAAAQAGGPTRCVCRNPEWPVYREALRLPLDSALWSRRGAWGIYVDHERFGLIAGSSTFVDEFRSQTGLDGRAARDELAVDWGLDPGSIGSADWFRKLMTSRPRRGGRAGWMVDAAG